MNLVTIDGHTICTDFIKDGCIVDIGCRWFNLSKAFKNRTYAVDIEDFSQFLYPSNTIFKHAALSDTIGKTKAYHFGNGSANFIEGINETPGNTEDRPCAIVEVDTITLEYIYNATGTNIDLLKIDAEGIEYKVLKDFKPIPKMLSIETHQHCHPHLHNEHWQGIFEMLCKDYYCILNVGEWPQYLFMDCLFIRKDLLK